MLIDSMECPKCGGKFNLTKGKSVGIIECDCNKHPIVNNIVIYDHQKKDEVLTLIENRNDGPLLIRSILTLLIGKNKTLKFLASDKFHEVVYELYDKTYADYLNYRYSCKSFFEAVPFIVALKGKVLDLGCGAGHFSQLISEKHDLISADKDFLSLLMAGKYFNLKNLVCVDLNHSLPFRQEYFDSIFCSDTFHYIDNKEFASKKMMEVIANNGSIFVLHLHNYLKQNYFPGSPLTPVEYSKLFPNSRIYPNSIVTDDYFTKDILDLENETPIEKINEEETISIVYSKNHLKYEKVSDKLNPQPSKVNRIYREGELSYPSKMFEKEHGVKELPGKVDLSDQSELAKMFVLLPEFYDGQPVQLDGA